MIHVIASIEIAEGRRDDFLAAFHRLIPKVLEEDGCIEYGPTVDVETGIPLQDEPRENVAVIIEKWESIEHLNAHLTAPHMEDYREEVKNLVMGMTLQVLKPA